MNTTTLPSLHPVTDEDIREQIREMLMSPDGDFGILTDEDVCAKCRRLWIESLPITLLQKVTLYVLENGADMMTGHATRPEGPQISQDAISRWTKLSVRTVGKTIQQLESMGYLRVKRRYGEASEYWLMVPKEVYDPRLLQLTPSSTPFRSLRGPWERLTDKGIRHVLEQAQAVDGKIGCAGCGRILDGPFIELDHLQPKAENGAAHMINRILLCGPCNRRKSNTLTMAGLRQENIKQGWMENDTLAQQLQQQALYRTTYVRDHWDNFAKELQKFMARS